MSDALAIPSFSSFLEKCGKLGENSQPWFVPQDRKKEVKSALMDFGEHSPGETSFLSHLTQF